MSFVDGIERIETKQQTKGSHPRQKRGAANKSIPC